MDGEQERCKEWPMQRYSMRSTKAAKLFGQPRTTRSEQKLGSNRLIKKLVGRLIFVMNALGRNSIFRVFFKLKSEQSDVMQALLECCRVLVFSWEEAVPGNLSSFFCRHIQELDRSIELLTMRLYQRRPILAMMENAGPSGFGIMFAIHGRTSLFRGSS